MYGTAVNDIHPALTIRERLQNLADENAKLRGLVRDLWPFVKGSWVHACPNRECCLFEECNADFDYECPIEEYIAGRMRELGVGCGE